MFEFSLHTTPELTVELPQLRMLASVHSPYVGANGNWYEWSAELAAFRDTGIRAKGEKGDRGATGATGAQGIQGVPGIQGVQGQPGRDGINGAAVAADGTYAFDVDAQGHLLLHCTGDSVPGFFVQDGHLYLSLE